MWARGAERGSEGKAAGSPAPCIPGRGSSAGASRCSLRSPGDASPEVSSGEQPQSRNRGRVGGGETGQKLGVCSCEEACREFSGRKTAPWVREHEAGIRRLFLLELLYEQTGRTARRSAPRRTVGFAVGLLPRGISVAGWKPRCLTTRRSVSTASRQKIIIIIIMKQSKQTKNLLQAC